MSQLHSKINPRSEDFRRNAEVMAELVADLLAEFSDAELRTLRRAATLIARALNA